MIRKSMINAISIVVVFGSLLLPVSGFASDILERVEKAKAELKKGTDTWNVEKTNEARDMFLNLLMEEKSEDVYLNYYIALCNFRLTAYYVSMGSMLEARRCTQDAKKYLEKVMESDPSWGEPHALYALLLSFEIALDREKAMSLGVKAYEYFSMAFEKEPENPRVNLFKGMSDLYTPKQYGGGPDTAIKTLTKALACFEKEKIEDPMKPSWGKDEAYAYLGMAYRQKGDSEKARESFMRALEINPDFGYAKKQLNSLEEKKL